jgi:hypothetical protein
VKKEIALIIAVVGLLFVADRSMAQEGMHGGAVELGVASSASSLSFEPFIGYFLTNNLEGVVLFDFRNRQTSSDNTSLENDQDVFLISAGLVYNFSTGTKIVPAFSGSVTYYDRAANGTEIKALQFELGAMVRFFVRDTVSVNLTGGLIFGNFDAEDPLGNTDQGDLQSQALGISYSIFF